MHLKLDSRSPVYVQVVQYFKEQIASGALEQGEEVPSRRELASKLKINPNTVQRAYKEMEEMGLIHTEGNMPSKVTGNKQTIQHVREELVTDVLDTFLTSVKALRIPLDEIVALVEKNYTKEMDGGEKND